MSECVRVRNPVGAGIVPPGKCTVPLLSADPRISSRLHALIKFDVVSYAYPDGGRPVLDDLSLEIPKGSFVLVVGPSGAGKSTFLRTINGLVPHFYGGRWSGHISVYGRDPVSLGPEGMASLVGFVGQDPEAHFVSEVVEEDMAFGMENFGVPPATMRRRVEEVLDEMGLAHLRRRRIDTLSGGEKQRTAIASILTLHPSILVLDEPTSQIDPQGAEEVLTSLRHLNEELGLTIVLSEHRLERVVQYADYILAFPGDGGRPIWGRPRDVLKQIDLTPPLVSLAKALGWEPIPLTLEEARQFLRHTKVRSRNGHSEGQSLGETVVRAEGIRFGYNGRMVLDGVSLEVHSGEMVALMGRNGVGKTTLLRLLVGVLTPQGGEVRLLAGGEISPHSVPLEKVVRHVGYVPQDPTAIFFADTVAEEVAFTRSQHRLPPDVPEALEKALSLRPILERYPRDLSGGEKQRAAIGAMLAADPEIILLDEPTRGMDYRAKESLARFLLAEKRRGRAIVMATHDTELVARCADRVVILEDGHVVADGPVREVLSDSPAFSTQVGRLFRDPNFLTVDSVLTGGV